MNIRIHSNKRSASQLIFLKIVLIDFCCVRSDKSFIWFTNSMQIETSDIHWFDIRDITLDPTHNNSHSISNFWDAKLHFNHFAFVDILMYFFFRQQRASCTLYYLFPKSNDKNNSIFYGGWTITISIKTVDFIWAFVLNRLKSIAVGLITTIECNTFVHFQHVVHVSITAVNVRQYCMWQMLRLKIWPMGNQLSRKFVIR